MRIKDSLSTVNKNGIFYVVDQNGNKAKHKPWLGDIFSFFYDCIMEKSVIPKKLSGSVQRHYDILKNELSNVSHKEMLDIAAGTGDIVNVITPDNKYTAVDISPGLLRKARKKTIERGFSNPAFYVADACQMPFADNSFDVAVCNLSLNFFTGIDDFVRELKHVLTPDAWFYCSVPVPERKNPKAEIHGTLFPVDALKSHFSQAGFIFQPLDFENGAIFYFKAQCRKD